MSSRSHAAPEIAISRLAKHCERLEKVKEAYRWNRCFEEQPVN